MVLSEGKVEIKTVSLSADLTLPNYILVLFLIKEIIAGL